MGCVDNSTSMGVENRYEILKNVVGRIARIARACNQDGISIRVMNCNNDGNFNGIMTEHEAQTNLDSVGLSGGTPLGTVLLNKVINPMILEKAKTGELKRPVLVFVVTDGEVCPLLYFYLSFFLRTRRRLLTDK
jgi:Mg-chelatase subunit ChlD